MKKDILKVGIAQIAPVWLDKFQTIQKIEDYVKQAANEGCQLLTFGETLLPGYPFWVSMTNGAQFNAEIQKEWYALYLDQSVDIASGDLQSICALAAEHKMSIYLGCAERGTDRGNHSVYCSLVFINADGIVQSCHRKLVPTYEERLVWANGDGHGLKVHPLGDFKVGGLNCWENWMPLSRTALYAQGESVHVAVWPGNLYNTKDITRFIALESRSYVISACSLLRQEDIPSHVPQFDEMMKSQKFLGNGGSCIASPTGEWLVEPVIEKEMLITAELDARVIRKERQNFDPVGHYSRPDVLSIRLNSERQSVLKID